MSRVIKFRAWDTKLQKMISWNPFIRFDDSEYVVQQFTGLFDTAGVEIYEGDIVKTIYEEFPFASVFYSEELASFRLKSGQTIIPLKTYRLTKEMPPHPFMCVAETVIGNIYENPELLK